MKNTLIHKFGGTSIGNPKNLDNIFKIIDREKNCKQIIVLSAFAKITDLLVAITEFLSKNEFQKALDALKEIYTLHLNWINNSNSNQYKKDKMYSQLDLIIEQIRTIIKGIGIVKEISENVKKRIIAFGEILSTSLFFIYINDKSNRVIFLNAVEFIKKENEKITVDSELLNEELEQSNLIITQGFICSENEKISNLGRGGSDYSAALIGSSIDAKSINIWTDVDGILTASPRIFNDAQSLQFISFTQIRELAKYGAKVLHLDTILPAIEKNIDVKILNTWNIDFEGTIISKNHTTQKFSISMLDNISIFSIEKKDDQSYLNQILKSLSKISANFKLLEVISNIDKTDIYYKNENSKSDHSIICVINPNISLISKELEEYNYIYDSKNRILKIFLFSDISEKLLNLIYTKLKKSLF